MSGFFGYDLSSLKVLIVEDNLFTQRIVRYILRSLRIGDSEFASNGAEAFSIFSKGDFDLVLTDLQMHPGDGLELTRKIRTAGASGNPYIPIIVMTGHTQPKWIEKARDAGATEVLAKPLSVVAVYEKIAWVVKNPRTFVACDSFFGPCRRRNRSRPENNQGRRESDQGDKK